MAKKVEWSPDPITVDKNATEITMNGKVYRKAKSISIARWPFLERYKATWIHGRQAHELHKVLTDLYAVVNKGTFGDTAVMLHNLKNDVAGITDSKRLPAAACITMLFWNHEGEDVGTMSDELMQAKLDDASKSGIEEGFFFSQALDCLLTSVASSSLTPQQSVGSPPAKVPDNSTTQSPAS